MTTIFEPKTFDSLFNIYKRYPDAVIFSGGIETILQSSTRLPVFPKNIIHLGKIEELQKMKKTERSLEIGASTKISHLIDKGKNIIPPILLEAIKYINPPNFKNILTLGGMICSKSNRSSLYTVLCILDTKVEIRSAGTGRWIDINHLFEGGIITLKPGEIITRIKIFLKDYDINIHREIDNDYSRYGSAVTFTALVSLQKDNIGSVRFIYSTSGNDVIRSKDIESELTGHNLPLSDRSNSLLLNIFSEHIDKKFSHLKKYKKSIILNTFSWFLNELNYYSFE